MRDRSLAVLALFLVALTDGCASAQQSAPAVPGPHALLIGCTRYLALPKLEGPANDVVLIETLLKGPRYQFPSKNVVVLSEQTKGSEYRPTRTNIEREFARLAQVARPGEQVVIAFSGHGSQQPDQDPSDPDDPEPDGLDETILPSDTGRWDERTQTVVNAIIDDELRAWLKRISERGALVWVIMDSCHSGTVVRAETAEVNRKVDPEVLGVPRDALERAERRAAQRMAAHRGETREVESLDLAGQAPDLVAVYAALPAEPTPELPPLDGSSPKPYGLLTYTLCRAITTASTPLSYADLVQRIRLRYAAWGRTFPTPLVEGKYRDREVLNTKEMPSRTRILLTRDAGGRATINAGSLQGLSELSILAVYPPPGDPHPDTSLGHVRIQPRGLALLDAQVEPWKYGGDRMANPDLPTGGRCQPVYIDLGRMSLGVAVQVRGDAGAVRKDEDQRASRELQQRVHQELRQIAESPEALIELHDQPRPEDWLVWIEQDRAGRFQAYLAPASGWVQGRETEETPPLFGPARANCWASGSMSDCGGSRRPTLGENRWRRAERPVPVGYRRPGRDGEVPRPCGPRRPGRGAGGRGDRLAGREHHRLSVDQSRDRGRRHQPAVRRQR